MKLFLGFCAALCLGGCAYEGVIVRKEFNPHEMPISLGVVASPKFDLRDSAGNVHSQLVSLEVFERYQVGDYFNDMQAPPLRSTSDFKQVQPMHAMIPAPLPAAQPSIVPATKHRIIPPTNERVGQRKQSRHRAVASRHHRRHSSVAARKKAAARHES